MTNEGFEKIWDHLPHISRYQLLILTGASLMAILGGFWVLWVVFGLYTPDHRCLNILDELDGNFTWTEKLNLLSPADNNCMFFNVSSDNAQNCLNSVDFDLCLEEFRTDEVLSECKSYSYDLTGVSPDMFSAVMEFDLVCEKSYIPSLMSSVTFVAFFFGAGVSGYVSDTFGRKNTIIVTLFISIVLQVGLSFSPNWWSLLVIWVFMSGFIHIAYIAMSVYIVEIVGPSKRRLAMIASIMFGVGYALISPISYGIPNWRTLSWSLALMSITILPIYYLLPTSPKWLHSRGRVKEAIEVLQMFAKKTGVVLPENIEEIISEKSSSPATDGEKSSLQIVMVFKNKFYRIVAVIMGYTFIATTVLYYGISFNAAALPGNLYVNNSINGLVEIAAYIVLMLVMGYLGRRTVTVGSILFSSVVCIIIGILLNFDDGSSAISASYQWLGFLGKFLISGTFGVIFIYAPEMYPTDVRTTGLGLASMAARIGGAAAPQIITLQDRYPWLPYTIFGIVTGTAGIAALWLPETFNQPIPQTLEEAEVFFRKQKSKKGDVQDKTEESTL